jgi:hypothetical protein
MAAASCFGFLVNAELPDDWGDLPIDQKFEAHERAVERAMARWLFTHPNHNHDAERWVQEIEHRDSYLTRGRASVIRATVGP